MFVNVTLSCVIPAARALPTSPPSPGTPRSSLPDQENLENSRKNQKQPNTSDYDGRDNTTVNVYGFSDADCSIKTTSTSMSATWVLFNNEIRVGFALTSATTATATTP